MAAILTADDALAAARDLARREGPRAHPLAPAYFHLQLVDAQWDAGDTAGALQTLAGLEGDFARVQGGEHDWRITAAAHWGRAGDANRAIALASALPPPLRDEALLKAAYKLMEAGHYDDALQVMARRDGADRWPALAALASSFGTPEQMEPALARYLTPETYASSQVRHCRVRAYARVGRTEIALAVNGEEPDAELRLDRYSIIAFELREAGRHSEAAEVLRLKRGLMGPVIGDEATLTCLVNDFVSARAFAEALQVLAPLKAPVRARHMLDMARRLREAGQLDLAETALRQVPRGFDQRGFEERHILVERIRLGKKPAWRMGLTLNPENAGHLLSWALDTYPETPRDIALAIADQSLALAWRVTDGYWRRQHFLGCAIDFARLGRWDKARALFKPLQNDSDTVVWQALLAVAAHRQGRGDLVAEFADRIVAVARSHGNGERAVDLGNAALILHQNGLLDPALTVVQHMNPEPHRRDHLASAQRGLVEALARAGRVEEAFGLTAQIDDVTERLRAWLDIYKALRGAAD